MVHILPHWTHKKGETVRVMAVSNCEEVELFLNGKSLGRKPSDVCDPAEWQVEFVPGRISAKAYRKGKCVAKAEQRTAGKPHAIQILPDSTVIKNDGADTAVVNFAVVDKKGIVVPYADNLIHFDVIGDGYIRGVGNGDPNSHELDSIPERKAFCGLCQALITSRIGAESISLRAWSERLEEASLTFEIDHVAPPICPKAVTNYILDGFSMSAVSDERPDPLMEIAGNDMNSFTPVQFAKDVFQRDFRNGWRIFRTRPKISADGVYKLEFIRARFRKLELYVDGEQIDLVDTYTRGRYVTREFPVKAGETPDIRILMYVENESEVGAGIATRVEMKETK
jgi:beta-galactosidase